LEGLHHCTSIAFRKTNMSATAYSPPQAEIADAVIVAVDEFLRRESESEPSPQEIRGMIEKENPSWKINDRNLSKALKKEWKARSSDKSTIKTEGEDDISVMSSSSTASKSRRVLTSFASSVRNMGGKKSDEDNKSTNSVSRRVSKLLRRKSSKRPSKLNIIVDVDDDAQKLLPHIPSVDAEEEIDLFISPINQDQPTADLTNVSSEPDEENVSQLVDNAKDLPSEVQTQVIEESEVTPVESEPKKMEEADATYVDDNDGKKDPDCACVGCTIC